MRISRIIAMLVALATVVGGTAIVQAGLVDTSTPLTVTLVDWPGTFPSPVAWGTQTSPGNGNVTLVSSVIPDGTGKWVVFDLTTNNGTLVGADPSAVLAYRRVHPTCRTATFNRDVAWWTNGGTPESPINGFGGIDNVNSTNPIPGYASQAPVYGGTPFDDPTVYQPGSPLDLFTTVTPYSFIDAGGNHSGLDNDFHMAAHFVSANAIPEPSTLIIWSVLGGVGIAVSRWRKRRAA